MTLRQIFCLVQAAKKNPTTYQCLHVYSAMKLNTIRVENANQIKSRENCLWNYSTREHQSVCLSGNIFLKNNGVSKLPSHRCLPTSMDFFSLILLGNNVHAEVQTVHHYNKSHFVFPDHHFS